MSFGASHSTTLISKDTEIVGDIKFTGDLEIQGCVKGNILAEGEGAAKVKVVEGGSVEGEIRSPKVVINGNLVGNVYASEHIELAAKAHIEGNVHYNLIEMVKGAQVNGNLLYANTTPKKATVMPIEAVVD